MKLPCDTRVYPLKVPWPFSFLILHAGVSGLSLQHSQLAHDGTMSLKREALAFEYPIESQRLGGGADQKVTNAEGERGRERER